jgi:hypothetical protein
LWPIRFTLTRGRVVIGASRAGGVSALLAEDLDPDSIRIEDEERLVALLCPRRLLGPAIAPISHLLLETERSEQIEIEGERSRDVSDPQVYVLDSSGRHLSRSPSGVADLRN